VDIIAAATRCAGSYLRIRKRATRKSCKNRPEFVGVGVYKLHELIYDALAHPCFLSQTRRAKAHPIDDRRRDAFFARSKDPFSTSILQGTPDKHIGLTNPEFHEVTAAMFGLPSPICKQHFGAQSTKQTKTTRLICTATM
jgi:hypothetical protein